MTEEEEIQAWALIDEWYIRLGQHTPHEVERITVVTMVKNLRELGVRSIQRAMDVATDKGVMNLPYVFGVLRQWREQRGEMATRPAATRKAKGEVMPFPSADVRETTILRRIQETRSANTGIGK